MKLEHIKYPMIEQNKAVYAETIDVFIDDVSKNFFVEKMVNNSEKNGFYPGDSEINSWKENGNALSSLFKEAELPNNVVVAFEYQAPVGGRVDCILFGQDSDKKNNVLLIELKGWKKAVLSYDNKLINTFTGGTNKDVLHPSHQAEQYLRQFTDFIELFSNKNYHIRSIAYCYNYVENDNSPVLLNDSFDSVRKDSHLFLKNDYSNLAKALKSFFSNGKGQDIINELTRYQPFPTGKLLDSAANIIIDKDNFHLYGDQSVTYDKILYVVKDSLTNKKKSVIVVKGGPGTGKTLIALKLIAALAKLKKSTMYATRSTALRDDLRRALSATAIHGKNASNLIQDIYMFRPSQYYENQLDILFVDEAHRVARSANADKTGRYPVAVEHDGDGNPYCPISQTSSLIYCAKVTVFFIDDHQAVQSSEIGNSEKIIKTAERYQEQIIEELRQFKTQQAKKRVKREKYISEKTTIENNMQLSETELKKLDRLSENLSKIERELNWNESIQNIKVKYTGTVHVESIELKTQFRCSRGDKFIAWIDEVLYKKPKDIHIRLKKEDFDFQIYDNPQDLFNKIQQQNQLDNKTARLCAGWCWPWSNKQIDPDTGDLKKEVVIGEFKMPWETRKGQCPRIEPYKSSYAPDTNSWMSHPMGINQIGCIHTAQGFEFDYVGVIIGPDMVYDKDNDCLKCLRENNTEGHRHMNAENENILIRNIYRVLMSRGKLGCYIFSCDPAVSKYLKRFML